MAEYLPLEQGWVNVDKIIRVERVGRDEDPSFVVWFQGGEKVSFMGHDAQALKGYLQANRAKMS